MLINELLHSKNTYYHVVVLILYHPMNLLLGKHSNYLFHYSSKNHSL